MRVVVDPEPAVNEEGDRLLAAAEVLAVLGDQDVLAIEDVVVDVVDDALRTEVATWSGAAASLDAAERDAATIQVVGDLIDPDRADAAISAHCSSAVTAAMRSRATYRR